MNQLPGIRSGLLKHSLEKQVLVYDPVVHRVHLLDPTTACVLDLLQEGEWTVEEIGAQVVARLDVVPSAGFLPLAIEELRRANLLDESTVNAEPLTDVNRRELLKTVAKSGAAALLIPAIASLTATRGYAQGTVANRGVCNTCTDSTQCISSECCTGKCMAVCIGNDAGACCSVDSQCVSGDCVDGFCAAAP